MAIEDDVKQIMDLWHSLEDDTKWELANTWLDKEKGKLEYIEAKVEELEPKVIHILKILNDSHSKADIRELHAHKRHLLRLLHHVKPTREWQREITEELDEIAKEVKSGKERAKIIIKTRREARISKTSDKSQPIRPSSPELIKINYVDNEKTVAGFLEGRLGPMEINSGGQKFQKILIKRIVIDYQIARQDFSSIAKIIGLDTHEIFGRFWNDIFAKMNLDYGELWPHIDYLVKWEGDNTHFRKPINFSSESFPQNTPLVFNVRMDATKNVYIEGKVNP